MLTWTTFLNNLNSQSNLVKDIYVDLRKVSLCLENLNILSPPPARDEQQMFFMQNNQHYIMIFLIFLANNVKSLLSKEKTEKHISKIEELKTRYRRLYTDLESLVENDKVIHNKIFVEAIFKIKM